MSCHGTLPSALLQYTLRCSLMVWALMVPHLPYTGCMGTNSLCSCLQAPSITSLVVRCSLSAASRENLRLLVHRRLWGHMAKLRQHGSQKHPKLVCEKSIVDLYPCTMHVGLQSMDGILHAMDNFVSDQYLPVGENTEGVLDNHPGTG